MKGYDKTNYNNGKLHIAKFGGNMEADFSFPDSLSQLSWTLRFKGYFHHTFVRLTHTEDFCLI